MHETALQYVQQVDRGREDLDWTLAALRWLSLDEFGALQLLLPHSSLPHLSDLLPGATPEDIQRRWTGAAGRDLLKQSVAFVSALAANYSALTGRSVSAAKVLDFGCGWARLLRLLPYYVDPKNLYGCDAWEASLDHARAARPLAKLAKSDVLPEDLPFPGVSFDLIYAFSVFTHLSADAAQVALSAFRKRIAPEGLVLITVRPVEFWASAGRQRDADYSSLISTHQRDGFAFLPANEPDVAAHYGDTSMSASYIAERFPAWEIVKMGAAVADPFQVSIWLKPR